MLDGVEICLYACTLAKEILHENVPLHIQHQKLTSL